MRTPSPEIRATWPRWWREASWQFPSGRSYREREPWRPARRQGPCLPVPVQARWCLWPQARTNLYRRVWSPHQAQEEPPTSARR